MLSPKSITSPITTSKENLKKILYLGMRPSEKDPSEVLDSELLYAIGQISEVYSNDNLTTMKTALEGKVMEEYKWSRPKMPYHITSNLIN